MNKEDILHFLMEHKSELENEFGVLRIGLFGSFVRGEARADSDVDIVVELKKEHISDHYFSLLHFLEDRLGKKIDLGIISDLRPQIRKHVEREIMYV